MVTSLKKSSFTEEISDSVHACDGFFGVMADEADACKKETDACKKLEEKLRKNGLRPTRQRLALAQLIFAQGHRHIAAEELHEQALASNVEVSLATVYNTLHQLTSVGLLRIIAVEGAKTWFDTNISDHHHFYLEHEGRIIDIPKAEAGQPMISNLPPPPDGLEIVNVDLIVRLRPRQTS